ncbi:hypothetical protein V8C40DRAFT_242367 [Trichoderma camerunense]
MPITKQPHRSTQESGGRRAKWPFTCLAGMGNDGDLPDAGFRYPPSPLSLLPICHPIFSNTTREPNPGHTRRAKLRHGFDSGPICVAAKPCVSSNPSRTAGGGGGLTERDTHEHSTPALRHAWNHHGHARNTIRYIHGGGWSAGLQSWGSVSHQPPKPKAGPGQTGIMASGKRERERPLARTVSFPPLTPPLSGWWAKAQSHRHTLFPFGLISSNRFCLVFSESRHTACIWGDVIQ